MGRPEHQEQEGLVLSLKEGAQAHDGRHTVDAKAMCWTVCPTLVHGCNRCWWKLDQQGLAHNQPVCDVQAVADGIVKYKPHL